MTSKEALEEIKDWVEYFTRLDYVEPVVRGEVRQKLKDAYWGTLKHFEKIEKDLDILQIIKEHFQVCFDSDSDNGLDEVVFNGFSLDRLWEDGYDDEFEKVKSWLEKGE